VLLQQPEPTNADLRFWIFGTHVRVHPLFWLMSAIFGWSFLRLGFQYLAIWIVCVFVSILIHELGHIFMGRLFGSEGHIVLHSFGGLAIGSNDLSSPWKRIAVSAAGPIAQLAIYGLLMVIPPDRLPPSPYAIFTLYCLMAINWYWPLLNLLPVYPLDGGQIVRDFLGIFVPRRALRASLLISATVAGLIALNSLSANYGGPRIPWVYTGGMYTAIFFGFMAAANVQALSQEMERNRWVDDRRVHYEDDQEKWDR
jgi:Zn-dependent protease